ncbi:MAG: hypothetical protein HY078_05635 [Elusimicrobia bacterium]|nr:hypothetical protein [Elusimicrobiota bacterium]
MRRSSAALALLATWGASSAVGAQRLLPELQNLAPAAVSQAPPLGELVPVADRGQRETLSIEGAADERAFLTRALETLQALPEGRRILDTLAKDYAVLKRTARISLLRFQGTVLAVRHGVEDIEGSHYGQAEPPKGTIELSRSIMDFKDAEQGLAFATVTLGHEIEHLVRNARIERTIAEHADAFDHDIADEEGARIAQSFIVLDLRLKKPTAHTEELRKFARDPEAYISEIKHDDEAYAVTFGLTGLGDPVAASKRRLERLKEIKATKEEELRKLPQLLLALAHMREVHGLAASTQDLWDAAQVEQATRQQTIEGYEKSIKAVADLSAKLRSRPGRKLLAQMKAAAADRRYRKIHEDNAARRRLLMERVRREGLPELSDTGQLDVDALNALVEKDKRENPAHWR